LIGQFGAAAATVLAKGADAIGAVVLASPPAAAQAVTDSDIPNFNCNIAPVDSDGLIYRRTSAKVLNIVYNGVPTGGFFPNRANGTIR